LVFEERADDSRLKGERGMPEEREVLTISANVGVRRGSWVISLVGVESRKQVL